MNWLLIVVIATLVFYAWRGKERGFIRTVFVIFSTIIAIAITLWVSPYVGKLVQSNDSVVGFVNEGVYDVVMSDNDDIGNKTTDEIEYIESMTLPSLIKELLIENKTPDVYNVMAVNGFKEYIAHLISIFIINVGSFLVIIIIVKILLSIIGGTLDLIGKLPIIRGLNRVAGLFAGIVHGVIVVWIGFVVITLFINNEFGQSLLMQINESQILSTIYNNNLILILLMDISKILF